MSNGYNTYVMDQKVGPQSGTSETLTANDPGSWSVAANDQPYGYTGVQMFDAVQQLTNDWNGSGWGGATADTPLASLSALKVNYAESSPSDANSIYEFAPDVWSDNYGSDVMFWADTSHTRCVDNGMSAGNILGQAALGGQNWTVYRYGGVGSEIIFILDGTASTDPVDTGTCAQQKSGTIDILGGYQWLASHGIMSTVGSLSQLNTGWEITSADNTVFTMDSYSITATVGSNPTPTSPSPSPTATSPSPTATSPSPSPTATSPSPSPTTTSPSPSPVRTFALRLTWRAVSGADHYVIKWFPAGSTTAVTFRTTTPALAATVTGPGGGKYVIWAIVNSVPVTVSTNSIQVS